MTEKALTEVTNIKEANLVRPDRGVTEEVGKGMASLVEEKKQYMQDLKAGRIKSGVTGELGKVTLVGDYMNAVKMPQLGGDDLSVRMPEPGGKDMSVRMPGVELPANSYQNPDFLRADEASARAMVADFLKKNFDEPRHPMEPGPIALESSKKAGHSGQELPPSRPDQEITKTEKSKDGSVTYTYEDGRTETKTRDGHLRVEFPDKSGFHIFPNGEMVNKHPDGATEKYDKDGNLMEKHERTPDGSWLSTDGQGRVLYVSSADSEHTANFKYDAAGNLTEVFGQIGGDPGNWTRQKHADGTVYWHNDVPPYETFEGDLRVDKDGNIHATANDRGGQDTVILRNGKEISGRAEGSGFVDEKVDEHGNVERKVYNQDGKLTARGVSDEDGARRYEYDENGKLSKSSNWNKKDGSWERSEFAENGNRTVMVRGDGKGNQEQVIYDPATGREVASDITFKDGSTMHIVFDENGNAKEVSSKDKNGNVNQWKRDAENPGAVVKDTERPFPLDGVSSKVIKFPNGFKVNLDFEPSSNRVAGIWTSDRDVNGVKNANLASIRR